MSDPDNPVRLNVRLDTTADPPVIISNRNACVNSGNEITWQTKGRPSFKLEGFDPQSSPFGRVSINDDRIECHFSTTDDPGTRYLYTITVEHSGKRYSSDKKAGSISEGKAVIRN